MALVQRPELLSYQPELTQTGSGLQILVDSMPMQTAILGLHIAAGSRHESPDEHGYAHFLEHMAFKGTHNYDAKAFALQAEKLGASMNAYTDKEVTAYYFSCVPDQFEPVFALLAALISEPTLPEDEINVERNVILQEIAMIADTPEERLGDLLLQTAFPNAPLGRDILGTAHSVQTTQRRGLVGFRDRYYHAPNALFSVVGDLEPQYVFDIVQNRFALGRQKPALPQEARYVGGPTALEVDCEQAHVALAWPCGGWQEPLQARLNALAMQALGGNLSSPLFQVIREQHGLVYDISTSCDVWRETGLMSVHFGCQLKNVMPIIALITQILTAIPEHLTFDVFASTQATALTSLASKQDSPGARFHLNGRHVLHYHKNVDFAELDTIIRSMTRDTLCQRITQMAAQTPTVAIVGPRGSLLTATQGYDTLRAPVPSA